jgi:hypothetical protein
MFGETLSNALGSLDKVRKGIAPPALFPVSPWPRPW